MTLKVPWETRQRKNPPVKGNIWLNAYHRMAPRVMGMPLKYAAIPNSVHTKK